ncbi:MAG TPA: monovalent cation/H(+) antiporter subunit G [Ilumatobacteraceae bacterium]
MKNIVVDVLLALGVTVQVLACIGVLVMRDAYQRLHYAAAATTLGPVAIAAAIVVREALAETGLEAILTAAVLLAGGAVLTHATGRAARIREDDGLVIRPGEIEARR